MFWGKWLGKKARTIAATCVENTVIYSVLEQVVSQEDFNHCYSMGRKHCNIQCFGASCLARKLRSLLQYGWKTRKTSVFWSNLLGKKAWPIAAV